MSGYVTSVNRFVLVVALSLPVEALVFQGLCLGGSPAPSWWWLSSWLLVPSVDHSGQPLGWPRLSHSGSDSRGYLLPAFFFSLASERPLSRRSARQDRDNSGVPQVLYSSHSFLRGTLQRVARHHTPLLLCPSWRGSVIPPGLVNTRIGSRCASFFVSFFFFRTKRNKL